MSSATAQVVLQQLELADTLRIGRSHMTEPQDLPGRYGRVVKSIDDLLRAVGCEAVVGGGWAVWRHGYVGRVTQDIDVVLAANQVDEFLRAAAIKGFDVLPSAPGRWPKLIHKETGIAVDILPEGQRPGTPSRPAPTTLPHPSTIGASGHQLRYIALWALIALKLAAGQTPIRSNRSDST